MTMDRRARADLLKRWATAAGFDRAGVASLEPSEHGDVFLRWLDRGDHAQMAYLERRVEARLRPATLLENARSVLCVALQYHPLLDRSAPAGDGSEHGDLWPRVARYARGDDYHDVMGRRLRDLAGRIEATFPDSSSRPYVDTGPVLERELAARAGLGVIGKNTNLLHREAGSWFLLGELFLTLDLAPDPPLTDLCGRCRLCLDACPTGALPEPYRLDSNRCISYWTIEHRGAIPASTRPGLGDWVFGCDVCQEVCPWNYKVDVVERPEFALPAGRRKLDLVGMLELDREQYVERFRRSPMKRAKLEGLQRNVAIAMGNRGDRSYVAPLARALTSGLPGVRGHAAWALGRIGGKEAEAALRRALEGESDAEIRAEVTRALDDVATPSAVADGDGG